MLYCRLIYMLSILCVRLTIKVKVGIPESLKLGWYPPKKTGSSHLKQCYRHICSLPSPPKISLENLSPSCQLSFRFLEVDVKVPSRNWRSLYRVLRTVKAHIEETRIFEVRLNGFLYYWIVFHNSRPFRYLIGSYFSDVVVA